MLVLRVCQGMSRPACPDQRRGRPGLSQL